MDRRLLECGCTFLDDGDWTPCFMHAGSTLNKVRKANAEIVPLVTCPACGEDIPLGSPCLCGANAPTAN